MPVGYHHLYYYDFASVLRAAGMTAEVEALEKLRAEEDRLQAEAYQARQRLEAACNQLLEEQYARIRPHLRLCHQRRFDTGKKDVEMR